VKPDTRTVNELFERDVRYVVPLYQRPYVWKEDDQWAPLWEDILVLLRHEALDAGVQSHFLGAIVLDQETQAPGRIPQYLVIDGQQRLTTLQLLIAAAVDVLRGNGHADAAGILADLTLNDPRKAAGEDLLKVWPTNINRSAFKSALSSDTSDDDPRNLIQEAHSYFRDRVAEWIADEAEGGSSDERTERLRVTVSDLLKVVTITLEPGDNAQVIFETLNARGTPLLALDLVKNSVFQEAFRQRERVDALYEEVWKPQLDDEYWREERRQGRLNRARGELFLTYWLGMRLRKVIPATELFAVFRKSVLNAEPRPSASDLVHQLTDHARVLRSFDRQPTGSVEALFFERLEELDVTTVMPLALLLFTRREIDALSRQKALQMLESWLVRRTILKLTTKNYTREVAELLEKVGNDPSRAAEIVHGHLAAAVGEGSRWPGDEEVLNYLTSHDAYGNIAGARLVMVLRAVERSLYTAKVDIPDVPRSLTLEHVMPQQWRQNWPLIDVSDEEQVTRAADRDMRLHWLGNLTLATAGMNATLSNLPWTEKQEYLFTGTKLLMNAELTKEYGHRFDESAIDRRTVQLASRICSIWPGPDSRWIDA